MRLSVVAVSLILLFSQSTLAQHSSGGGGSSGGTGGSSSGSSGGGSHGGGGSSGGSSGAHVSGGGSGSHGSGSSGSSHAPSGFVHAPGKVDTLHETVNGPTGERVFYSSLHGESSEVHSQLLDQALAKLQYALPANFKNEQPFAAKSLKRIEPAETKPQVKNEEREGKPCHGHNCHQYCAIGTNWLISQDLYTTVQGDCGHLAAKLAQEESKVAALQAGQSSTCTMNPAGSACASATKAMNTLNAKVSQLHDRYDQCVLHDLRHKAAITVSPSKTSLGRNISP